MTEAHASPKDAALKLALEVLKELNNEKSYWWQEVDTSTLKKLQSAEETLEEALAQPEQEMVSYERFMGVEKELADMTAEFMRVAKQVAQPEQEPVAFDVRCYSCGGNGYEPKDNNYYCSVCNGSGFVEKLLYTTPPQRKPLTDEEIMEIGRELGLKCRLGGNSNIDFDYARAIEAAHGIKE